MNVVSLNKRILILSSIKNGSFDYSVIDKMNLENFCEKNSESSITLFDYILYKIIYFKIKDNIAINENIIIISEEYLKNNEYIIDLDENKNFEDKIFLIPYMNESNNKWILMIFSNLFKQNEIINVKLLLSKENNNILNNELNLNDIIYKINPNIKNNEIKYTTDIYTFNENNNSSKFLLNLINKIIDQENTDNIENYIKTLFKNNQKESNILEEGEKENNTINIISSDNNLFQKVFGDYKSETQTKSNIFEDEEEEENINLDQIAKKIVNNIMNIGLKEYDQSTNSKNSIESNNEEENIDNNNNNEEKNELDNFNDIFDLNFNEKSNLEKCNEKKIDEITKNTIDDILDSVLKDMELENNKYKKNSKKNKKQNKYKKNKFNIDKKIDIIKEEDKESSTSGIPEENIINNNNINIQNENEFEDEKENKINYSFDLEKRASSFSYNKEKYDDSKIKEGEIDFEENNIINIEKKDENNDIIIKENFLEIKDDNNAENVNRNIFEEKEEIKMEKEFEKDKKEMDMKIIKKKNKNNYDNNKLFKKKSLEKNNMIKKYNNINNDNNNDNYEIISQDNIITNTTEEADISNKVNIITNTIEKTDIFNKDVQNNNNIQIDNPVSNNIVNIKDSPKDNNRNERKRKNKIINIENNKNNKNINLNIKPPFKVKNIINNNNIKNININTINAKNIIIINNTIFNRKIKPLKKKKEKKEKILKIEKVPEDEKVPKDNLKKKFNNSQIFEKVPSDNPSKYSTNQIKFLIKESFRNTKTKYNSRTIKIDKYKKKEFYRNNSDTENRINKIIKKIKNYNLNTMKSQRQITLENEPTNYLYKNNQMKDVNKTNKSNSKILDKFSIYTYKNNKYVIKNFDDKYNIINNYNNKPKTDLNQKTLDNIKSKSMKQKDKFPMKQNNMIYKKIDENKDLNDDICILF